MGIKRRTTAAALFFLLATVAAAQDRPAAGASTTQEANVQSLRDITGIEEQEVEPWAVPVPWLVVAGLVMVLAVVVMGRLLVKRARQARAPLTAEAWARHELTRISALDLGGKGQSARHHVLVSNVLRGYIEKRFEIPARRRTTEEFLRLVGEESRMPAEQQALLRDFLTLCDLGKFTGAPSSQDDCRTLISQALEFIQTTSSGITESRRQDPSL